MRKELKDKRICCQLKNFFFLPQMRTGKKEKLCQLARRRSDFSCDTYMNLRVIEDTMSAMSVFDIKP